MATKKQVEAVEPTEDEVVVEDKPFSEVEGADLLIPPETLTASQTMRLMGRVQAAYADAPGGGGVFDMNTDTIADLIDFIGERYAVNQADYDDFGRGGKGLGRMLTLITAYAAELGKDAV